LEAEFNYIEPINMDTEHIFSQPYSAVIVSPPVQSEQQQPCDHQNIPSPPPPPPPPPTPTTTPTQLVENNVQLPHELLPIQNSENCYQNFTLKNKDEYKQAAAPSMTEQIEIMATSLDEQLPISKGKNITK
jgi:hypothetical protein